MVIVLHDEFGFGPVRLRKVADALDKLVIKYGDIMDKDGYEIADYQVQQDVNKIYGLEVTK